MSHFILVSRTPDSDAALRSQALRQQAVGRGLTIVDISPQVWLATYGPRPPKTLAVGAWTLVGDVFNRARHPFSPSPPASSKPAAPTG